MRTASVKIAAPNPARFPWLSRLGPPLRFMSDSRTDILRQVRSNRPESVELPDLAQPWQSFEDVIGQFRAAVSALGAQVEQFADKPAADAWLQAKNDYASARCTVSVVAGIGRSTLDLNQLEQPAQLANLDWAVLPGQFGIAENGAIWVDDATLRHRAVYFLCEHLVLVVGSEAIVSNMHQAYERLKGFAAGDRPPYGAFIAGPSKTADIEQSLVVGAQGPRSLDVLIVNKLEF